MRMPIVTCLMGVLAVLAWGWAGWGGEPADALLEKARAALSRGKVEEGLALASKAVAADPRSVDAHFLRGLAHERLARHAEAVADFGKVVELHPKAAEAYQHRGSEQFKLGKIAESIKDFDRYIELRPEKKVSHWQRGISYYYAGRFKDGQLQFEGYQDFDGNDVENGVWRYLCQARVDGRDKARAAMLKIGPDKRVPMKEIYDLFRGKLTPADVLAAARAGDPTPEQLGERLFYAHLYIGLYHDSEGDKAKALEHLTTAAEHRIGHYMWDVARVHRDILRQELKK